MQISQTWSVSQRPLSRTFIYIYISLRISIGLSLLWTRYTRYSKVIAHQYRLTFFMLKNCDHDFRNCDVLCLPKYKTFCYGKRSLRYSGAVLRNTAPNNVKQAETCLELKMLYFENSQGQYVTVKHAVYVAIYKCTESN